MGVMKCSSMAMVFTRNSLRAGSVPGRDAESNCAVCCGDLNTLVPTRPSNLLMAEFWMAPFENVIARRGGTNETLTRIELNLVLHAVIGHESPGGVIRYFWIGALLSKVARNISARAGR